jgi:2-amino-4-hydroxy-6-hydroxymethyldihydropteridine diphosphokinase
MDAKAADAGYDAIVALGSNIGDKQANIAAAIEALVEPGGIEVVRRSRDFRTPPWGVLEQDWFVNACIAVRTALAAPELLKRCQGVEDRLGRVRMQRWGPRVIDVDVLDYRGVVSSDPSLTLPHPRITERAFVLAPLADIAPDLVLNGKTVRDWLAAADRAGVVPFGHGT